MSVLDHIESNVQVWDGLSYSLMPLKDAKKLEKDGTHQITTNLQASQLKTAADFNKAREAKAKSKAKSKTRSMKAETGLPGVDGEQTYKTREMKAE